MRQLAVGLGVMMFCGGLVAEEIDPAARSALWVSRFAAPPQIDGVLDDPCWQTAKGQGQLFLSATEGSASEAVSLTPKAAAAFYVGFDDHSLYFAARCEEPLMPQLVARFTERDSPSWQDDCVEFFFDVDHDRDTSWHLVINPLGTVYDELCSYSAGQEDASQNTETQAAAARGEDHWSVEARTSLASLGAPPPGEETVWTMNVCRVRRTEGELSAWADVGQTFHQPGLFGTAFLGNPQAAVRGRVAAWEKSLPEARGAGRLAALRDAKLAVRFEEKSGRAEALLTFLREASQREAGLTALDWLRCDRAAQELERHLAGLRRLGLGFQVWARNLWGDLHPRELPPPDDVADLTRLDLVTTATAYRAAGFAVTNFMDDPLEARVLVSDLQTERGADTLPADALAVRVAQFVELRGGSLVPDALPRLNEARVLQVPADQTRLVWLTLATREARPGRYTGTLTFKPLRRGVPVKKVDLHVTVLPLALDHEVGRAGMWTSGNACLRRAALHDLLAHGGNTIYVLLCCDQLYPWCDAEGNVQRLNTEALDQILQNARSSPDCPPRLRWVLGFAFDYSWYRSLWPGVPEAAPLSFMSPPWKKAFRTYLLRLRDYLGQHGIQPEDLIFYPYDEPTVSQDHDEVAEIIEVAKLVHEADARFRVFTDPPGLKDLPTAQLRRLDGHVEVFCPYVSRWSDPEELAFYQQQMAKGQEVWGYSIVGKTTPPLSGGYRAGHWQAFKWGFTAFSGFWCYDSWHGDMWDDYDTTEGRGYDYAVVYTDHRETYIPSRRWEAWREGVDDFRALTLLRSLCDQAEEKKIDAASERQLLSAAVENVLQARDPDTIERERVHVMTAAAKLHAQLSGQTLEALLAPRTTDEFGQHLPLEGTLLLEHFNGEVQPDLKWVGQAPAYAEGAFPGLGAKNQAARLNNPSAPQNGLRGPAQVPKYGTLDFWVKPAVPQPQPSPALVMLGGGGHGKCGVRYDPQTRCVTFSVTGSRRSWGVTGKQPLPAEQWTRVTCVYAADGVWLYLNGQLDAHQPYQNPDEKVDIWYSGPDTLFIGCWETWRDNQTAPDPRCNFTGSIDELRLLDYPLSLEARVSVQPQSHGATEPE